eukprot:SAG31_NODE_6237_length_2107_cov_2.461155_3_plen_25_part_01
MNEEHDTQYHKGQETTQKRENWNLF